MFCCHNGNVKSMFCCYNENFKSMLTICSITPDSFQFVVNLHLKLYCLGTDLFLFFFSILSGCWWQFFDKLLHAILFLMIRMDHIVAHLANNENLALIVNQKNWLNFFIHGIAVTQISWPSVLWDSELCLAESQHLNLSPESNLRFRVS